MRICGINIVCNGASRSLLCYCFAAAIAAMSLATSACENKARVVQGDTRADTPEMQQNAEARPAETTVHPIELKRGELPPAACRVPPADLPVRSETKTAMIAFIRWVALMTDPVRHAAGGPWFLEQVRAKPDDGWTTMLVPPAGYDVAWLGGRRAASMEEASHSASHVVVVELRVRGTVERGRGASALIGELETALFTDSRMSPLFGVIVEFCIMPAIDGVAPVYLQLQITS
jgi:hypothetical protein